jgi:hypothetical protein
MALLSLEDGQIAVRVRMDSVVLLQKVWDDCPWMDGLWAGVGLTASSLAGVG